MNEERDGIVGLVELLIELDNQQEPDLPPGIVLDWQGNQVIL